MTTASSIVHSLSLRRQMFDSLSMFCRCLWFSSGVLMDQSFQDAIGSLPVCRRRRYHQYWSQYGHSSISTSFSFDWFTEAVRLSERLIAKSVYWHVQWCSSLSQCSPTMGSVEGKHRVCASGHTRRQVIFLNHAWDVAIVDRSDLCRLCSAESTRANTPLSCFY